MDATPARRLGRSLALLACAALLVPVGTTAQDTATEPLPEPGTVLEAGRYASDQVGPSIDFRVDAGWVVGPTGDGPIFTLEFLPAPGTVLSVTRFDGETFLETCDPSSMTVVEANVSRLAEIIAGNPFLNATAPGVLEVDGHRGLSLDVGVPRYEPAECSLPYLLLWAVPIGEGGEFVQVADQQSRFLILDVDGDVIVIAIESLPGVPFGGFLEASMELVQTMRIVPGDYRPPEPTVGPEPSPPVAETTPGPSPSPALPPGASA